MRTTILATVSAAAIALTATMPARAGDDLSMEDMLAPQYIYMEFCKDWPPLPPDRLRAIDLMTEMVDKRELHVRALDVIKKCVQWWDAELRRLGWP